MLAPGTLYCLAKPSTSWIRAIMAWNSLSASPIKVNKRQNVNKKSKQTQLLNVKNKTSPKVALN